MEYKKDPFTYEEQADLLISRGLRADRNHLINSLRDVNYYRMSGYLYPYRDNNGDSDVFIKGASFEDVWRHYTFDRCLRFLLMDAIERVEISLRSRLVYYFVHDSGPFGYLDYNNFPNLDEDYYIKLIDELKKEINRSKEIFLDHFFNKYGDIHEMPPLWIACELFNFGALLTFFRGVDKEIKRKLALDIKIPDILLFSWLRSLGHVRNICAHHGRVWNKDFRVLLPKNKYKYIDWFLPVEIQSGKIFTILTILKYLLRILARNSKWHIRLYELLDEYQDISLESMGFPENWVESNLWRD